MESRCDSRRRGATRTFPLVGVLSLTLGCALIPRLPDAAAETPTPEVRIITTTPLPPVFVVVTATPRPATPTPEPSPSPTPACRKSASVTLDDVGKVLDVCGVVVDVWYAECEACEHGLASYLALKGGLQIVSYDWLFNDNFPFEGVCLKVHDLVETLEGEPFFVMDMAEGYMGSSCVIGPAGIPACDLGSYLNFVDQSMCY